MRLRLGLKLKLGLGSRLRLGFGSRCTSVFLLFRLGGWLGLLDKLEVKLYQLKLKLKLELSLAIALLKVVLE